LIKKPAYIKTEKPAVEISTAPPSKGGGKGKLDSLYDKFAEIDAALVDSMDVIEKRVQRTIIDHTVINTTIGRASQEKYWGKHVEFTCNVIAKATSPYLVPFKIQIDCPGPSGKWCASCLVDAEDDGQFEINLMQEDIIALVDNPKLSLRDIARTTAKIPHKCKAWRVEVTEKASVQDLLVTGTFDNLKTIEEVDAIRRVLYLGHDIETNAIYTMQGKVFSNPKNNEVVYMIDHITAEKDDILDVEITEDLKDAVKIFQPKKLDNIKSIKEKLKLIYDDLSDNVTKIYGRFPLHFLLDLGFHSVLYWRWESDPPEIAYKGTTEILILGDSGQGKSETMLKLRDYYKRGERIDCKSATYAGLVGGLDDFGGRRYMVWGRIPQNDRGAVILDEVKGMPTELVAQLTDVRSSQTAIVTRVGGTRRTTARVRFFWLSNPRGKLQVNKYGHGVVAINDLIGTAEDIRRFDAAIIVSSGEVNQDFIDRKIIEARPVKHIFEQASCRALLTIIWSRVETVVSNKIKKHIVKQASILSKKYSTQIPLLEPSDARQKIARLSIALAGRLGSFDKDWNGVLVNEAHVDVIVEFLQMVYDNDNFAFDRWSENQEKELVAETSETDEIMAIITSVENPKAFVETIAGLDWLPRDIIQNACDNDRDKAEEIIALFIRLHYLTRYKTSYRKTPKLIALLRKIQDQGLVETYSTRPDEKELDF